MARLPHSARMPSSSFASACGKTVGKDGGGSGRGRRETPGEGGLRERAGADGGGCARAKAEPRSAVSGQRFSRCVVCGSWFVGVPRAPVGEWVLFNVFCAAAPCAAPSLRLRTRLRAGTAHWRCAWPLEAALLPVTSSGLLLLPVTSSGLLLPVAAPARARARAALASERLLGCSAADCGLLAADCGGTGLVRNAKRCYRVGT
jgi:hypothetical protein